MAGLNVGDIVQISLRGRHAGQRILSIFHYQTLVASSAPSTEDALLLVAQQFDAGTNNPTLAMLACLPATYTLESVRAQRVYPVRSIYVDAASGLPGLTDGNTSPNWAVAITRRGPNGGRKYVSTLRLGPITADDQFFGLLSPAFKEKLEVVATRMKQVYSLSLDGWEARPIIYNKSTPGLSLGIVATTVQPETRVMRRRTVGLGE